MDFNELKKLILQKLSDGREYSHAFMNELDECTDIEEFKNTVAQWVLSCVGDLDKASTWIIDIIIK